MAFIAKELVRALGYTDDPKDFAFGYKRGAETPAGPRKVPSGTNGASSGSNAVRFWFRQSPKYLSTSDLYYQGGTEPSLGRVTDTAPPWDTSGMAGVELDHRGFLRKFHAVPPTNNQTGVSSSEPDWFEMFSTERIGFDLSKLSACDPIATPLTAFDQRRSWSGQVLGDDPRIHVTAAAFNGKTVYFEIFAGDSMESTSTPKETPEIFIFFSIVSLTLILGAIALTWRNLKSGRCDRPGANKVACYVVCVSLISWLLAGHHIPAPAEFRVFGLAFNWAVGFGVMVWVFYVAFEPFIRRRWPQLLISWTRLLRGQWYDGLVARDLLLGTACGVLDKMLWFGSVAVGARNQFFNVKQPLSDWVAWVLITHITTILTLFAGLLILALLGGVLRSKMLVGCVTIALVSTIIGHDAQLSWAGWASVLLVVALNMVILLRFGFLAAFGRFCNCHLARGSIDNEPFSLLFLAYGAGYDRRSHLRSLRSIFLG